MKKKPCKILYSCFWAVVLATGIFRAEIFATDVTDPTLGTTVAPTPAEESAEDDPEPDTTVIPTPTEEESAEDNPEPDITVIPTPTEEESAEDDPEPDTTVIPTPTEEPTVTETPAPDAAATTVPAEPSAIADKTVSVTPKATPSIVPDQKNAAVSEAAKPEASDNTVTPVPNEASYIITIPETIDFGTLTQPDSDADSWITSRFLITAELTGFSEGQAVQVFVKDSSFSDGGFYLTQESVQNPFRLSYDIYKGQPASDTLIKNGIYDNDYGYALCEFMSGASSQDVTLSLNSRALYGQDLNRISGDYTGHITFHSRLNPQK